MSDQRKLRQELRQGLHQYLMQLYQSYLSTLSEEEAKKIVAEEIQGQYEYFTGNKIEKQGLEDVLKEKINELTKQLNEQTEYDRQLFYAEKVDSLTAALEILNTQTV